MIQPVNDVHLNSVKTNLLDGITTQCHLQIEKSDTLWQKKAQFFIDLTGKTSQSGQ